LSVCGVGALPFSPYMRTKMSSWLSCSHSLHFSWVPLNSQYYKRVEGVSQHYQKDHCSCTSGGMVQTSAWEKNNHEFSPPPAGLVLYHLLPQ
jgi:hypothetical protein